MKECRFATMTAVAALCAIAPLPLAGPAHAQSTPEAPAAQAGTPSQAVAPSDAGALQEIVVTAQKRSENVQKVAATVSVVDSATLQSRGITDLRGLTSISPMVNLNKVNTGTQIFIRGVGQTIDSEFNDPAVAANMDGIYTPRYTLSTAMFDIDHVEVLSGPQGTLYGRNAAGGAINLTSKLPSDHFEADGFFEIGNYKLIHAFAGVSIPVTDDLALRAAVDSLQHSGYLTSGQDDQDTIAGRLTAVYRPSTAFSVTLRGEYQHAGGNSNGIITYPYLDPSNPWYQPKAPEERFYHHLAAYKASAEFKYNFGGSQDISLAYIPGYIYYTLNYRAPLGEPVRYYPNPGVAGNPLAGFAAALNYRGDTGKQLTNELRLTGNGSKLKWVAGLYEFHHNAQGPGSSVEVYNPAAFTGGSIMPFSAKTADGPTYQDVTTNSVAAFGQATYSVTNSIRVTGGLRYSSDHKRAHGIAQTFVPIANLALPPIVYNLRLKNSRFDYKAGIEADLSPDSMAYAAITTGFIGGGFNVTAATSAATTFKPEHLVAYTAGIKNTLLDRRLRLNAEIFYYDYRDLQVSAFNQASGAAVNYNVPKSANYGAQVDVAFRVFSHTTLDGNVGYLHAKIKKGILPPAAVFTCGVGSTIPIQLCSGNNLIDYSGYTLPDAPTFSGSFAVIQEFDVGNGGIVEARVDDHFETKSWSSFSHFLNLDRPAYTKVDASVTYRAPESRWSLGAWVKNIGNVAHVITPATTSVYGLQTFFIEPPRTYGLRLGFKFD